MRGLLVSVWLLLAGLYTISVLALIQPFSRIDDWPLPPAVNETVRAKAPRQMASKSDPEAPAPSFQLVSLAEPVAPKVERRNEWVQIAGYTTGVRAQPSASSPVLFAYAVGRPLRVIAREGGFARVQDLGSGQLGWVQETSLAPFTGGYRQRDDAIAAPQLVASAAPQAAVPQATVDKPQMAAAASKKGKPLHNDVVAARTKKELVALSESGQRGFFGMRRNRPQRVALSDNDTSLTGLIDRAFKGR
jgi:hypothetical protein